MTSIIILQMDPGVKGYRYYIIKNAAGDNLGQVLVPKTTGTLGGVTYDQGTEYWFDVDALSTRPSSLTFYWDDYEWTDTPPTLGTQSFTMVADPTWEKTDPPATTTSNFVNNTLFVVLGWQLTLNSGVWGGSLHWYNDNGQNTVFGGSATSPVTLTGNIEASRSVEWYTATVTPS